MKVLAFGLVCATLGYGVATITDSNATQCVDITQYSHVEYEANVWSIDGAIIGYSLTEDAECITPK